jgi:hypothetical protein
VPGGRGVGDAPTMPAARLQGRHLQGQAYLGGAPGIGRGPLHRTVTPVTIVTSGGNVVHVVSAYPKDGSHDE